jgi:putative hydrolase of the HAD superfamily
MIQAVIFDMGNTLLRYERPGAGTWFELEERGIRGLYRYLLEEGHPLEAHEDAFLKAMFARLSEGWEQSTGGHINLRAVDWIAAGAAEHQLTLDERVLLAAAHAYARPVREGVVAVPGALEALSELRARGCRVGMISNTIWPGELHLEDLDALGLLPHIEHTIFSGDAGIWKPAPAIFRHALDALQAAPEHAVFVGDSPREDILGAQAAGMRAIWVRSAEFALGDVRPDAIIADLTELLAVLDSWPG